MKATHARLQKRCLVFHSPIRINNQKALATLLPSICPCCLQPTHLFISIRLGSWPAKLVPAENRFLNQHSNERGLDSTMVWCAMLRHAETPKGPRGVPKLSNDRFKDGPLHGPVGRLLCFKNCHPERSEGPASRITMQRERQ